MSDEQDYKYDLFISYNRADEDWARKLATRVEQEDWQGRKLRAFFAPWDIRPGESVDERLDRALSESRFVGLVLSPDAVDSEWVSEEWYSTHHAGMKRKERRIIPLNRRACKIPIFLDHLNRIDFRDDDKFDDGLRLLLAVLREEPLPRGDSQAAPKDAAPPSPIPRPPVIGFVARRDAQGHDIVERLRDELAPGRNQLATLSGPGGIGKTTLAAEAARSLQQTYKGRVVWSSADGRADFALLSLLDDISTQLGRADLRTLAPAVKEEQVRSLVAEAPTLVVLDNYETIAAEEKKRIETWFKAARCSALFTSRPRVAGTVFVPVSAMSREEADDFLERLAGQTQDAQTFTVEVRRRVYETAEANPFVMQWVVGQIDDAQEPDTVFEELAEGEGDAAERVFNRSFNLPQLGDDGRDALLALSLFAPSATREALSAVAGFDDEARVREAIRNLNRLWLIKLVDEHRRFAVEGLTRRLAAASLSKDPRAEEFRRRFVAYFLRFAEERKEPTPENYDALEGERDNLLSAAETAFASEDWGSVTGMAYVLAGFGVGMLCVRGYWGEAVRLGEQALQAARSSQDEVRIAGLSHNLAVMYQTRGEPAEARRLYDESLEIHKRIGNQSGVAGTLHQLGWLAQDQGEMEEARRLYGESLEINKRLGNQGVVANTLHALATLADREGDLGEARRLLNESLEITNRLGDKSNLALLFNNLGLLEEKEGNKAEAARLFREALSIFERLHSPNAEVARRSLARVGGESSGR
jgi:tetratricopeptide (TPR) repeat protein